MPLVHGTSCIDATSLFGGMVMRTVTWLVCAPALLAVAACGRGNAADEALKNDLALASQAQSFNPNFNPNEAGYAPQNAPQYSSPNTPRTVQTVARQPIYRRPTSTARRSTSSNSGYYPAPAAPPVIVEKHTKRDAAIGAGAGAVLGAITSRDKVKGGLIGAMVGGVLGGVIGNNVDITRKSGW